MKRIFATLILALCASVSFADVPLGYYQSVTGLKKSSLKAALHNTIQAKKVLDYGSGNGSTWSGFYQTDRMSDGEVRDRYSNDHRYFASNANANSASAVSGMNIEHSFPKSWWGGSTNNAYKDLFNLMPCESTINSSKSNYPMGKVTKSNTDNGCTKVGTGPGANGANINLWEPADKWKGDFARSYMYMATTYSNFTWTNAQGLNQLENNAWPTLQKWAYELFLEWCRQDPVDEIEIARNEAVYKIQGNRNPFIDFPNLAEYVWGDSVDVAFDINTTMKSSDAIEGGGGNTGGGTDVEEPEINYDEDGNLIDIAGLIASCTGSSSSGPTVTYKFDDVLVTYAQGKNTFITDGQNSFLVYGTNDKVKTGDRIRGSITGVDCYYNNLPELNVSDLDDVEVVSSNNAVSSIPVCVEDIIGEDKEEYYSALVTLEAVTPQSSAFASKKLNVKDETGEVMIYDTWQNFTDASFSTSKQYNITGLVVTYYSTIEVYPVKIIETSLDGVESITETSPEVEVYDLQGRRVTRAEKGIFIQNGKKVIR